jgi:hypothetical protein
MHKAKDLPDSDDLCELVGKLVIRNHKLVMVWILCYVELLQQLFEKGVFLWFLCVRVCSCAVACVRVRSRALVCTRVRLFAGHHFNI